ncbi:monovalent cation:proton antiporter-2 (CPA2) family protein [Clostridium sp. DL1XJH146]
MELFLLQLFIFLAASAIAVPIAKKLGLGSVLGYLIAGIVIGPFGFSLIADVESVMHFTEFGVVMMLFLVGLELKPSLLWEMRVPIIGMGGAQVIFSAIAIGLVSYIFLPWQQALAVGLILALSSTAIVVQTLKEKGLMNTTAGRSIFSVLLFQDLAVIPMLALMPLLATGAHSEGEHIESALIDITGLPGYIQLIIIFLAIFTVFIIGKYASRPIFRAIAETHVREIFVGAALAMVVGISLLMTVVGLSPALGTFIAGVVLADSEYRHELESDIEPFKGLLLGIFFISIGASLNFTLIGHNILLILGITVGLIVLKFIVLFIIGHLFKMEKKDKSFFAISLAQGGEFAFVLFQLTRTNGVLQAEITEPFISAVAISMFLAPVIFKIYEKIFDGKKVEETTKGEMDSIEETGHKIILAGFGQLGTDIGRFLLSAGVKPVILDHDAAKIDLLRKFGFEVYYGDVTRLDLLEAAGAGEAELLILTMSDVEISRKLVELVNKYYPHLKIVANASDMSSVYELMDMNVTQVRRETSGTALTMGQDVLKLIGRDPYDAYRLMRIFRKHDDDMIPELHKKHKESLENYISIYKQQMENLEELMTLDMEMESEELDKAWTGINPDK